MVSPPRDEYDRADLLWPHCDACAHVHCGPYEESPEGNVLASEFFERTEQPT
jgi:hypothetical protein